MVPVVYKLRRSLQLACSGGESEDFAYSFLLDQCARVQVHLRKYAQSLRMYTVSAQSINVRSQNRPMASRYPQLTAMLCA